MVDIDPELTAFNDTAYDYGDERTIPERIAAQAAATPEAVALRFGDHDVTYAELDRRTNQLAHRLAGLGVGRDDLVAVFAERSIELVLMLVGVLKAGAAYVPLDCDHPAERLTFLLDDTDARAVLTHRAVADRLPPGNRPVIVLDDDAQCSAQPETALSAYPGNDDLAYVLYTSGSTGNPKGVMVEHGAIRNRLQWMQRRYPIGPGDTVLQKTPDTFDVSVWEFFWPIMVGARMVIARPNGHRDNGYLAGLIAAEQVTTIHFVPTMLRSFLNSRDAARATALRRIFCSGEALTADLRDRCFAILPGVELHNLYGPTEAAVDVTFWQCRPEHTETVVPIGRPIDNIRCYVLDEQDRPVPVGADGELHLAGVGLARGYLNRPELTAGKFPPDPFAPGRMYRTGDLARWQSDGTLAYLGRNDDQVKLNGQRIELGEVEAALLSHPDVSAAAAVVHRPAGGMAELIGYVCGPRDPGVTTSLLKQVAARLPSALVPSAVLVVPEIPMTTSGKTDRKRLPDPALVRAGESACLVPLTAAGSTPPWIWVHAADGEVGQYADLADAVADQRPSVGLEAFGLDDGEPLAGIPAIAARHVAELRRALPDGPYHLAGQAEGALVAYEIAVQLRAGGAEVARVVLIEPGFSGVDQPYVNAEAVSSYRPEEFTGAVVRISSAEPRWNPPAQVIDRQADIGDVAKVAELIKN
ncbi:amino acid adenylation domain-containing protein [Actinoplanes sp. TFC3]|uniref:amino acid adenylation domain-containing protein n=1 Tax=Actinoplanes sp. TFC3 TaxID=1710355 RepID=UPI0008345057|nr:amino acid adenylation domain-containing protein [Actinoplanes sp. TFC3]